MTMDELRNMKSKVSVEVRLEAIYSNNDLNRIMDYLTFGEWKVMAFADPRDWEGQDGILVIKSTAYLGEYQNKPDSPRLILKKVKVLGEIRLKVLDRIPKMHEIYISEVNVEEFMRDKFMQSNFLKYTNTRQDENDSAYIGTKAVVTEGMK